MKFKKTSKVFFKTAVLLLTVIILASCASTTVKRTDSDEVIDLSGRWNDTDSRLVAEEMVTDSLSRPWLTDYIAAKGSKPVLIVGTIRNKSSEHIETGVFIKDIERELINSGKVTFVASKIERDEIREERKDQQTFSTMETVKDLVAETGADFMMIGQITSVTDAVDGKKVVLYQVDMEIINLESNEKVWIGSKEVKKFIKKSKSSW